MAKIVEKYFRCDNCDLIKGACRCTSRQFTIYLGKPDESEIPDNLAADNFMYIPEKEEKEKNDNAKVILVNFIKNNIKDLLISHNDSTKVFVRIDSENYVEFYDLRGIKFLHWLKNSSFRIHNTVYSDDSFSAAISLVYSQSQFEPNVKRIQTYIRIAQTHDAIYYDLCNDKHEIVKITPGNVEILPLQKDFPVFVTSNRLATQVKPDLKNYDHALDIFVDMISITDEEKFLFKIHLISAFLEGIPVPIIDLFSEQGKGKSQITASVKMIVDPQSNKLIENINKMPTKEESFLLECNAKYFIAWDNVSHITPSQSDDICRMITGGATEKRMLYSDYELVVQYLKRKFTLNGIGINITRGDYLDRSINYSLKHIDKIDRWTDEEYEEKLKSLLPGVLADVFQTISKAMKLYPSIKDSISELPRLAGFGVWGEAISQSRGNEPGLFLSEYEKISADTLARAGENHPLVKYVEFIMKQTEAYNQPVSKFYNSMKEWVISEGFDTTSKFSNFPKSVQAIRSNLQRVNGFIRELGYFVTVSEPNNSRTYGVRGAVYITISHILAKADDSSMSACQPVNVMAGWQGDRDDDPNFSKNTEKDVPFRLDLPPSNPPITQDNSNETTTENNKTSLSKYTCNNCNTFWNTSKSLEEIQKQHSIGNEGHTVVPNFNLGDMDR